ncbi:putative DMAP1-like protein [Hamiltosporidium magnivora]|uniref:Putative DMAP1-like protein n=1 Tax=Hamiltosporidium magnivora TaxID=148818 RepID=A0A4Q9L5E2_9MICR|nr:putative DMAP1-like protein [Hamiltosporidium magnivora]
MENKKEKLEKFGKKQILLVKYENILKNIDEYKKQRNDIIRLHFGELNTYNLREMRDIDQKILEIIGKEPIHPPVFLASSLGFNKMNWNKSFSKILGHFNLGQRLKYPTAKNAFKFEKLKMLLIKYQEICRGNA